MTPPPRIHFIMARAAPVAVVFRRGPSKQIAVLKWNLKTDALEFGQWLKGRIYPMRADISPDGKHMIYLAMNGRWQDSLGGSWTAISEVPWLTALHIYGWGHCWNGGGLFHDDKTYWLNTGGWRINDSAYRHVACGLSRSKTSPEKIPPAMGEDPMIYIPRLLRDGWRKIDQRVENGARIIILEKDLRKGWRLEKSFHAGIKIGPNGECYADTHRLIGPRGTDLWPGAEAADALGSTLLFARNDALWRQRVHAKGPEEPKLVRDLTDMKFEPRIAPYSGAQAR